MNNPLLDNEFLMALMNHRQRDIYGRITLLNQNELPIEQIEGRITAGSINVDGNSALRRTCNVTMVLFNKKEINQFNWAFKSKFKMEIGIKNTIDTRYPEIIWFKQGIFILTTCNMNQTTNNYTITINGKDKMCLLNGDLSGSLTAHSYDFGTEEFLDTITGEITYNKVLLKDIIRNVVCALGGELPENIIINDLDEDGLELLEYRQEEMPMFLFRNKETGEVSQVTLNSKHQIYAKLNNEIKIINIDGTLVDGNLLANTWPTTADVAPWALTNHNNKINWNNWQYYYENGAGSVGELNLKEDQSGIYYHIIHPNADISFSTPWCVWQRIPKDDTREISYYFKGEVWGYKGDILSIIYWFKDINDKVSQMYTLDTVTADENNWHSLSGKIKVPANIKELQFGIQLKSAAEKVNNGLYIKNDASLRTISLVTEISQYGNYFKITPEGSPEQIKSQYMYQEVQIDDFSSDLQEIEYVLEAEMWKSEKAKSAELKLKAWGKNKSGAWTELMTDEKSTIIFSELKTGWMRGRVDFIISKEYSTIRIGIQGSQPAVTTDTFYIKDPCFRRKDAAEKDDKFVYADTSNIMDPKELPTDVYMQPSGGTVYNIIKFEYGDLAGYRITDLVYAGELKANAGETLVSVLDKIVKMLSNFEYFYNLDGKFVFQKKRTYISTPWNSSEINPEDVINQQINDSYPKINLRDAQLTTAFANNPNLLNAKNDFSVWGTYKTMSGADAPIHMRYAIDIKPTRYQPIRSIWTRRKGTDVSRAPQSYLYYAGLGNPKNPALNKVEWSDNGVEMVSEYLNHPFVSENDPNKTENDIVVDWREIIYQMALDYYSLGTNDDFFLDLAEANPHYPTGRTGYEQYYIDMNGFWRQLYNPHPEPDYWEIAAQYVTTKGELNNDVYLNGYHREIEKKEFVDEEGNIKKCPYDFNELYVIREIEIINTQNEKVKKLTFYPFVGSQYCHLSETLEKNEDNEDVYYWYYSGNEWKNTMDENILNIRSLLDIYIGTKEGEKESVVELAYNNFIKEAYGENPTISDKFWKKVEGYLSVKDLRDSGSILDTIYRGGISTNLDYVQYLTNWALKNNYGELADDVETTDRITYMQKDLNGEFGEDYWNIHIFDSPETLFFWFDFLPAEDGSDIYKYSVQNIGPRTKVVNDSNVKTMYYREVPNVIFLSSLADKADDFKPGYTYIQLPPGFQSLFSISGRGKSAKERIDELLQDHSYVTEQANITTVPLYNLEPNTRIAVKDELSNIDGEYIVTKVTVPLAYNGTMSLSTTKVISNIM